MRKGFKATRLKDHQRKWWEHEERMEDQQIPKHTFQIQIIQQVKETEEDKSRDEKEKCLI